MYRWALGSMPFSMFVLIVGMRLDQQPVRNNKTRFGGSFFELRLAEWTGGIVAEGIELAVTAF
jgi:hypothetical protein